MTNQITQLKNQNIKLIKYIENLAKDKYNVSKSIKKFTN